jgi:hypothetical protein
MDRRRRDLIRAGIADVNANPGRSSLLALASLAVVCAPCIALGYAFDEERRLAESTDAGGGLIIGFLIWLPLWGWFMARGGVAGVRQRRLARRREEHIQEIRNRRNR